LPRKGGYKVRPPSSQPGPICELLDQIGSAQRAGLRGAVMQLDLGSGPWDQGFWKGGETLKHQHSFEILLPDYWMQERMKG